MIAQVGQAPEKVALRRRDRLAQGEAAVNLRRRLAKARGHAILDQFSRIRPALIPHRVKSTGEHQRRRLARQAGRTQRRGANVAPMAVVHGSAGVVGAEGGVG